MRVFVKREERKNVANKHKESWVKRLIHNLFPRTISPSSSANKIKSVEMKIKPPDWKYLWTLASLQDTIIAVVMRNARRWLKVLDS